ncbi:hypothetical protein ACX0G9_09795 [Flavitalea flava]
MKPISIIIPCIALLIASGCHQKNATNQPDPAQSIQDSLKKSFFPVADFLQAEISYVDSTPLAIRKYNTENGRTDSSLIQTAEFHQLAVEFLLPELAKGGDFEKNFSENSFLDETTGYLTFTYSTRDKELPLQRVDVLAAPGTSSEKVRSIYLEKAYKAGDTSVIKKMYWKAKQSLLIITNLQVPKKAPVVKQLRLVWDIEQ